MKINIGLNFVGLLTIVFIALKLTHYITWSWIWVVSPLWIPFAPALIIYVILGILHFIIFLLEWKN